MALIYANAVNKRMNNASVVKPKKKQACPFRDESPFGVREERKRSSSREQTPLRKNSSITSSSSSGHESPVARSRKDHKHRPVQRSKTSCGAEMLNRIDEESYRKSSHPVMTNSSMSTKESRGSINRSSVSKKSQKMNGEGGQKNGLRRKSISLDAEEWQKNVEPDGVHRKDSAFSRMMKKFSKWSVN